MSLSRIALPALMLLGMTAGASAQQDNPDKWNLKPLVPPLFNLQSDSQMQQGRVGGQSQTPYTTAPLSPLQDSTRSPTQGQSSPGLKLTFPAR